MPHDPTDLERDMQRALDALPTPRAPRTLLPRIMADVHAQTHRVPHRRPWFAWSPMSQAALIVVSLAVLTWAYWLWPFVGYAADLLPEPLQQASRRADVMTSVLADLVHVGSLVWDAVVGPIVKGLLTLTLVLCTACALVAVALGRIALGGAHQS